MQSTQPEDVLDKDQEAKVGTAGISWYMGEVPLLSVIQSSSRFILNEFSFSTCILFFCFPDVSIK